MQIIDVHIHPSYGPIGENGILSLRSPEETAADMIQEMDRAGISICGILGRVQPGQTEEHVREGNSHTMATVRQAPGRLYGMCYIHPGHSTSFVAEELDRVLSSPEVRGIKLEVDVNCRDERLDLVMQKSIQYQVPVLHHSWYVNTWQMKDPTKQKNRSEPDDIADLAQRHPQARILMAHMEGSGIRGILDVADLDNVWVDTSGSQPFTGTLEFAMEALPLERIVYGSDMYGRDWAPQLGRILGAGLSPAQLQALLFDNAVRLFGLSDLVEKLEPIPEPIFS